MTIDRHTVKLRELVDGAGFRLEPLASGRYRVDTKTGRQVAFVEVSARGFQAAFPDTQRRSSTPTELVDDLEDWTAGHQKGKW